MKPLPLESFSVRALRALVKLLLVRGTVQVSNPTPYVELQEAGWAYRVASVRGGFVFNEDNREAIEKELRLR